MKFNIDDYQGKYAMHCKTEEAADFLRVLDDLGLIQGYTILEWSDFMNKEFTKADLKNGDVVLRRDGSVDIVCVETNTLISSYGFDYLKDVGEDLTDIKFHDSDFDIIAVRRPTEPHHCQFCAFDCEYGELVYEREKVEEYLI